jgi:hypothetical protein
MKLFDNEYVTLSIDEMVPCMEWVGKKFIPSNDFRASEEKSLEFYQEYKKKYPRLEWFVDARLIGPISPADTQWVVDNILPQFSEAGLKKEVFVVPKSALGQMAVTDYVSGAGQTIEMKVFDTAEAAKDWLKE